MSPKKPDFNLREWSQKLEAGERDDPTLDLAAQLKEDRPKAPRPDPAFKTSLRARLVGEYEKPGVMKNFWNWASYGLALVILVGVLVLAMELLPGGSFPAGSGPEQTPESSQPASVPLSPAADSTAAATSTDQPENTPGVTIYTVKPGDTCTGIALTFGVSMQSIAELNDLPPSCDVLFPGQKLRIPQLSPTPSKLPTPLGGSGRLAFNYFPSRISGKQSYSTSIMQEVYTANPDGSELTRLTNGTAWPNTWMNTLVGFSPNGRHLLVFTQPAPENLAGSTIPQSELYGSLYAVNVDGSGAVKLTDGFRDLRPGGYGGYTTAYWLPDSNGVVYIATGEQGVGIFRINADGSQRERLTDASESPLWLLPSPDGNGVYWEDGRIEGNNSTQGDFHNTGFDGSGTKPVWENLKDLGRLGHLEHIKASISPNGKWIAFIKRDCPDWRAEGDICQALNIADIEGNLQTAMYYSGSRPAAFTWAPDGEHILVNVLVKNEKGYGQTFHWWGLAGPDLKLPEELEIWSQDGYPMGPLPQWSPDGTQILFENFTWPLPKILDLRRLLEPKVSTALEALRPEAGVSGPYGILWIPLQK